MRVLVTGAAGFVGFNILSYLKHNYNDIHLVGIDNLRRRGSELNVSKIARMRIDFHHIDLKNKDELNVLQNSDIIIHCASDSSVLSGISDSSSLLLGNNLIGSINIFEHAVKCDAKLIFFSTNRVYPNHLLSNINYEIINNRFEFKLNQNILGVSNRGISEDFPLHGSRTFYGASKICGENLLEEYAQYRGLQYVTNRFGVISGKGQLGVGSQGIISFWLKQHFLSKELKYIGYGGEGLQVRDALHIQDVCHLIDLQLNNFNKVDGKTFNVGGGYENSFSLKELTILCQNITGKHIQIGNVKDDRPGDIPIYFTDNSKICSELNWQPKFTVTDILEDINQWYKMEMDTINYF